MHNVRRSMVGSRGGAKGNALRDDASGCDLRVALDMRCGGANCRTIICSARIRMATLDHKPRELRKGGNLNRNRHATVFPAFSGLRMAANAI